MQIKLSAKQKNILVGMLFVLALFGGVYSYYVGQVRNPQLVTDYQTYRQMDKLSQKGGLAEAEALGANIVTKYPNSYLLRWKYGKILSSLNKNTEAKEQLELAQQLRPALLLNSTYLSDYGKVLMKINQYQEAQRYLLAAQKFLKNGKERAAVDQLLKQLTVKLKEQ